MNATGSTENKQKLEDEHENLIKQVFALRFIKKTLLDSKTKDESVLRALKIIRIQEYLYLNSNKNDTLLNLGDYFNDVNVPYTAQKALREGLTKELSQRLATVRAHIQKMENDLPNLFEANAEIYELIELEAERRSGYKELVEEQNKQIKLWDSVMTLKLSAEVENKLEVLRAEMQLNQTKADLMASYIESDMLTRTDHSLNAYKTVNGFIDNKLNEEEGEEVK